ncbi:MAG: hypothetical protein ABI867_41055 [Kofleriaceae bacterium]
MNCPTCGAKNDVNAVFCCQCATNITGAGTGVRFNPNAHAPPPQQYGGYGSNYVLPSRSSTILTLGILSLVVCGIMGPIAWSMGSEELRRIDAGETDPTQRGTVVAGRICGIIATSFMILSLVIFLFLMVGVVGASHRY